LLKFLLFITFVVTNSFSTKLIRSERKIKSQDDGSGSWENGFDCPGIQISSDNGKTWTSKERVIIRPLEIVDEKLAQDIGIKFEFSSKKPSEKLKQVLISGSDPNKFILPYRLISGKFTWSNPNFDNKYIQGSVTNDLKITYQFKLLLPYKTIGWYINDKQLNSLCESINKKKDTHTSSVQKEKANAESASGSYISNKLLLEEAEKNAGNNAALKANAEAQKVLLSTKIDLLNTNLIKTRQDIANLESQLAELKSRYDSDNSELNSLSNQMTDLDSTILSASSNTITFDNTKKEILGKVNNSIDSLTTAVSNLSLEVPTNNISLTNGKNEVITNKKSEPLKTTMKSIQP